MNLLESPKQSFIILSLVDPVTTHRNKESQRIKAPLESLLTSTTMTLLAPNYLILVNERMRINGKIEHEES